MPPTGADIAAQGKRPSAQPWDGRPAECALKGRDNSPDFSGATWRIRYENETALPFLC